MFSQTSLQGGCPGLEWVYLDGSYSAHLAMKRLHDHVREGGDLGGNFLCNATNSKLTSNPISWSWMVPEVDSGN